MCGIAAYAELLCDQHEHRLSGLLGSLSSRGPDESWSGWNDPCGMAFTRLAIERPEVDINSINPSSARIVVLLNGEIWNYRDLVRELDLPAGATEYDVIRTGYQRWGLDIGRHITGMYSIVIYDTKEKCITALRDPVGIKPLFWAHQSAKFAVASDVRSVLEVFTEARLNVEFVYNELMLNFNDYDTTIAEGVVQLPPGGYVECRIANDVIRVASGKMATSWVDTAGTPEASLESLRELLSESVRRTITHGSQEKVGLLLSGGIDSALLAVLAREIGLTDRIIALSVGKPDSPDVMGARRVAELCSLELFTIEPDIDKSYIGSEYERATRSMNGYEGFHLYCLFRQIKTRHPQLRVILCGEGADELYDGYPIQRDPVARLQSLHDGLTAKEWRTGLMTELLAKVPGIRSSSTEASRRLWYELDNGYILVDRHLIPFDHASMAHGIEVRVPYLEWEHVRLARDYAISNHPNRIMSKYPLKVLLSRLEPVLAGIADTHGRKRSLPQAFLEGSAIYSRAGGIKAARTKWYADSAQSLGLCAG